MESAGRLDKWDIVTDHTEWKRKYFLPICSTSLSSAVPEIDHFQLGWNTRMSTEHP